MRSICDTEINLSNTMGKTYHRGQKHCQKDGHMDLKKTVYPTKKFAGGMNM